MISKNFIEGYKNFLRLKNKSNNTIELYVRDITLYLENYEKLNSIKTQDKFTELFSKNRILNYFSYLKETYENKDDGVAINKFYRTLSRKFSGFSKFLDYLVREREINENFLNKFDRSNFIKKNREQISRNYTKWIPEEELKAFVLNLIELLNNEPQSYKVHRDIMIIIMLIFTGLRASELENIKIIDIDLNENFIHNVKRKRKNISEIPIEKYYLKPLLINYLNEHRNEFMNESDYLFLKSRKSKIDRHLVYRVVSKYSKEFLGRQIHPHILRHTFATIMCIKGANISDVRDMLDHENISSTELYEHVNKIKNKYEIINNFSSETSKN